MNPAGDRDAFIASRYGTAAAVPLYGLLCRALIGAIRTADWEGVAPGDWQLLMKMALHEGVAGPLWRASEQFGWREQMPAEVRQTLHRSMLHVTAANTLLLTELERVLAALTANEIPVILLKGAALALTLYERPGSRVMGDLDILIAESDVEPACAAIVGLGYRAELSRLRRWLTAPLLHEMNFDAARALPVHLEVHWDLLGGESSRYRADMAWFWARAERVRVGRQMASVLAPGPMLLHLAAHVALKHGEERAFLRWYYDIHLLIERHADDLAWDELLQQAAAANWGAGLHAALVGVGERFGTPIPEEVMSRLASANTSGDLAYLASRSGRGHWGRLLGLWHINTWRGRLALLVLAVQRIGSKV